LGKRVALVEAQPELGGAGANTGTVPSKTLRETALALSGMKTRNLYGVDLSLRRGATNLTGRTYFLNHLQVFSTRTAHPVTHPLRVCSMI
jgi:pyruvate/2-oxoglutarate dehydrogenase complex dihydrolipoamide dehydrogenase (E3) component